MSKKIATFKDLDTLANLGASTSSGYITGATDEQCVTKENFNTVSDKTIEAKGNGLMFVEDSESSKYESSRLILLDDVQYISEITAELVSAPNIPAKGGSACATWLLTQYYKTIGDETQRVLKEWTVDGSNVSADSKGTTISTVTDVANSEVTVTNKGKSISLSQMIKQDLNKIEIYGDWTTPTVTVNPDSFAAAGGTATITISGDSTRENTWSSGSKSTDSAWISRASATLGTVSNDYKTLNIGLNDTSLDRSGNVIIEWSFDDGIVTTVESKKYSQVAQSSSTLTLNKVNKTYDGSASYITATASVSGTIYYGTSSSVMNNQIYVNGGDTVKLIECGRTDVGTTTVYAYLKPSSADYSDSSTEHAEITITNASITVSAPNQTYTYTGSAQGSAITATTVNNQPATIAYRTTSSGSYNLTSAPTLTSVGSTTVYYKVTAPNHAEATGSYKLTITTAGEAYVTVNTVNSTYTGSAQETLVAVTTNGVSTWTLGYTTSNTATVNNVSWGDEKSSLSLTNAGTYYIWVKWQPDSNHTGGSPNGEKTGKIVTINKRKVKITDPTETNWTYSGSAYTIFAAGSCTPGGVMYYSDTDKEFSTSTWRTSPPYTEKTNAGTYILYYYCYVSDTTNNTGTNINTKLSISATINKKSATISFDGSNLIVQCKNSATSLGIATDVRYLAATATGGSVSYTIDSIQNPSGVTGTFISESKTALRLRVAIGTPVGDYSVDITASQSNPNYTSTPVTRTYKISVLPDTLGDYTGTLSISNPSTKLSAGDDTRTITWGAIHQVWKHGGNKVYMPYTANLTVSCNDSTAKKYVSINKKSYENSSDTTTTTLTKTTYSSVYEHGTGAIFTLELRKYDGTIIKTLDIAANPNNKIHTLTAVNLSYSVAGSTSGSTNIPSVTYDTTYGYQSGAVISTTTGNTSPTLDNNTTFTKSFEEYQSNGYASVNASTGVVTWNSSNPSSTERKMTVKCTGVLDSKGITSSKSVIAEAKQSDTSKSIRVSYVNSGCPYGCSYRVLAKAADLTTIQYGSAIGNFHTETYGISELTVVAYATNQSGSSKTLTLTWSGGGGTSTMIGTGVSSASRSTLSITVPNGTYQGSNTYYIAVTLTSTGNMSGSIQFSLS